MRVQSIIDEPLDREDGDRASWTRSNDGNSRIGQRGEDPRHPLEVQRRFEALVIALACSEVPILAPPCLVVEAGINADGFMPFESAMPGGGRLDSILEGDHCEKSHAWALYGGATVDVLTEQLRHRQASLPRELVRQGHSEPPREWGSVNAAAGVSPALKHADGTPTMAARDSRVQQAALRVSSTHRLVDDDTWATVPPGMDVDAARAELRRVVDLSWPRRAVRLEVARDSPLGILLRRLDLSLQAALTDGPLLLARLAARWALADLAPDSGVSTVLSGTSQPTSAAAAAMPSPEKVADSVEFAWERLKGRQMACMPMEEPEEESGPAGGVEERAPAHARGFIGARRPVAAVACRASSQALEAGHDLRLSPAQRAEADAKGCAASSASGDREALLGGARRVLEASLAPRAPYAMLPLSVSHRGGWQSLAVGHTDAQRVAGAATSALLAVRSSAGGRAVASIPDYGDTAPSWSGPRGRAEPREQPLGAGDDGDDTATEHERLTSQRAAAASAGILAAVAGGDRADAMDTLARAAAVATVGGVGVSATASLPPPARLLALGGFTSPAGLAKHAHDARQAAELADAAARLAADLACPSGEAVIRSSLVCSRLPEAADVAAFWLAAAAAPLPPASSKTGRGAAALQLPTQGGQGALPWGPMAAGLALASAVRGATGAQYAALERSWAAADRLRGAAALEAAEEALRGAATAGDAAAASWGLLARSLADGARAVGEAVASGGRADAGAAAVPWPGEVGASANLLGPEEATPWAAGADAGAGRASGYGGLARAHRRARETGQPRLRLQTAQLLRQAPLPAPPAPPGAPSCAPLPDALSVDPAAGVSATGPGMMPVTSMLEDPQRCAELSSATAAGRLAPPPPAGQGRGPFGSRPLSVQEELEGARADAVARVELLRLRGQHGVAEAVGRASAASLADRGTRGSTPAVRAGALPATVPGRAASSSLGLRLTIPQSADAVDSAIGMLKLSPKLAAAPPVLLSLQQAELRILACILRGELAAARLACDPCAIARMDSAAARAVSAGMWGCLRPLWTRRHRSSFRMPAAKRHPMHRDAAAGLSAEQAAGLGSGGSAPVPPRTEPAAAAGALAKTLRLPADALLLEVGQALADGHVALARGRDTAARRAAETALRLCGCSADVTAAEAADPPAGLVASAHLAAVALPARARACALMARAAVCGDSCLDSCTVGGPGPSDRAGVRRWAHPLDCRRGEPGGALHARLAASAAEPWARAAESLVQAFPAVAGAARWEALMASAIVQGAARAWVGVVSSLEGWEAAWTAAAPDADAACLQGMLVRAKLEADYDAGVAAGASGAGLWVASVSTPVLAEAIRRAGRAHRHASAAGDALQTAGALEGRAVLLAAAAAKAAGEAGAGVATEARLLSLARAAAAAATACKDRVVESAVGASGALGQRVQSAQGMQELALVLGSVLA